MKENETIDKFQGWDQSFKEKWNKTKFNLRFWSFKISANKGAGGPWSKTIGWKVYKFCHILKRGFLTEHIFGDLLNWIQSTGPCVVTERARPPNKVSFIVH